MHIYKSIKTVKTNFIKYYPSILKFETLEETNDDLNGTNVLKFDIACFSSYTAKTIADKVQHDYAFEYRGDRLYITVHEDGKMHHIEILKATRSTCNYVSKKISEQIKKLYNLDLSVATCVGSEYKEYYDIKPETRSKIQDLLNFDLSIGDLKTYFNR